MRHNKTVNHLGRTSSHRKAMLSNMASSLILHKRIFTTVAKAKALKKYVEPLITKSKEDTTHSRRVVFSYLENKYAVSELFKEVAQKLVNEKGEFRPGGYTRILRTATRLGDNADMCMIELVDYNEAMLKTHKEKAKDKKTTRRGGKKAGSEEKTTPKVETKKAEKPVIEEVVAEDITADVVEQIAVEDIEDAIVEETADVVEDVENKVE